MVVVYNINMFFVVVVYNENVVFVIIVYKNTNNCFIYSAHIRVCLHPIFIFIYCVIYVNFL